MLKLRRTEGKRRHTKTPRKGKITTFLDRVLEIFHFYLPRRQSGKLYRLWHLIELKY